AGVRFSARGSAHEHARWFAREVRVHVPTAPLLEADLRGDGPVPGGAREGGPIIPRGELQGAHGGRVPLPGDGDFGGGRGREGDLAGRRARGGRDEGGPLR